MVVSCLSDVAVDLVPLSFFTSVFGVGAWYLDLAEDNKAACFSLILFSASLIRLFPELLTIKRHAIHHTKIPNKIPIPGKRLTPKIMKTSPTINIGMASIKPSNLFVIVYIIFFISIFSHSFLINVIVQMFYKLQHIYNNLF